MKERINLRNNLNLPVIIKLVNTIQLKKHIAITGPNKNSMNPRMNILAILAHNRLMKIKKGITELWSIKLAKEINLKMNLIRQISKSKS